MTGPRLDAEHLLEHTGWMRRLALRLVKDRERAEDLAQDTWLRALESPPRRGQEIRAWLTVVMRNLLRKEHRATRRRRDREVLANEARPSHGEDAPAALVRATAQRELLQSVIELEEPYRTTLLLRYFEELSPRRIAHREGVPTATVKTRLARGLERLRQRYRSEAGAGPRDWMLALVPILRPPQGIALPWFSAPTAPELSLGALAMNAKLASILMVATALGAGYLLVGGGDADGAARPEAPAPEAPRSLARSDPAGRSAPGARQPESDPADDRVEVAPSKSAAPSAQPEPPADRLRVRGRVVDLSGRPVSGVRVVAEGESRSTGASAAEDRLTLGDGSFELELEAPRNLYVRDARYVTVMGGVPVRAELGQQTLLVAAPRVRLEGRVIDESSNAVAGAHVTLAPSATFRAELGLLLDYSFDVEYSTESAADGSFRFAEAPGLAGGSLVARQRGFAPASLPAPVTDRIDVQLVLERPQPLRSSLRGVVLDAVGSPVADAWVSLGFDTTQTAADGAFTFDFGDPESFNTTMQRFLEVATDRLIALHPDHSPGELRAIGRDEEGLAVWPDPIVLRLAGASLSLTGRIVDGDESPLPGIRVWLADPTFFGGFRDPRGGSFPSLTHVETQLGGLDPTWPFVESDSKGAFRLTGLMDREYTLEALDPETLQRARTQVRPGGAEVELTLRSDAVYPSLAGRIVDGRGQPVPGASVRAHCDAFSTRVQGQTLRTRHGQGNATTTDREGRFQLQRVPRELVYLRIDHPDTIPLEWGRTEQRLVDLVGEEHDDLTLTVMRRCHFRVELASPGSADALEIHDADGEPLAISEFQGNGRRDGPRATILGGSTNLLAVDETATTLVLFLGGEEVRRSAISLTPGDRPTLRP